MLGQTKIKFKKAKLPQIPVYKEIEEKHKKHTPNPRIDKIDQIEKDVTNIALSTEWDYKIQNLTLRQGVNHSLINNSSVTYSN